MSENSSVLIGQQLSEARDFIQKIQITHDGRNIDKLRACEIYKNGSFVKLCVEDDIKYRRLNVVVDDNEKILKIVGVY